MKTDWYKGLDPNLERLASLLGMAKPSHGYTVAEKAPEVVTAPGVYFPATKGEVIPLTPRQNGGEVVPSIFDKQEPLRADVRNEAVRKAGLSGMSAYNATDEELRKNPATGLSSPSNQFGLPGGVNIIFNAPSQGSFKEDTSSPMFRSDQLSAFKKEQESGAANFQKFVNDTMSKISLPSLPGVPTPATSSSYGIQPDATKTPMFSRADGGTVEPSWLNAEDEAARLRLMGLMKESPAPTPNDTFYQYTKPGGSGEFSFTDNPKTIPASLADTMKERKWEDTGKGMFGGFPTAANTLSAQDQINIERYNQEVGKAKTEQANYDAYLRDRNLQAAAGIVPRLGMDEYDYGSKLMRMTPAERLEVTKNEGDLAKQYYVNKGTLDVAGLKTVKGDTYGYGQGVGIYNKNTGEVSIPPIPKAPKETKLQHVQEDKGDMYRTGTFNPVTGEKMLGEWQKKEPTPEKNTEGRMDYALVTKTLSVMPKLKAEAVTAVNSIQSANRALDLVSKGVTGKGGQFKAWIAPYAEMLGYNNENLNDSQAFQLFTRVLIGPMRLDLVGSGPVSDYEQKLMKQLSGGGGAVKPAAIELLSYYREKAKARVDNYNQTVEGLTHVYPKAGEMYKRLGGEETPSGNAKTADDLLKKYGVK